MRFQPNRRSLRFRLFVLLFTGVFTWSSISPAQAQFSIGKAQVESGALSTFLFRHLKLPENLAFTEKTYQGKKSEAIWILNDAHAVPAAQESISQTIQFLQKEARLRFVGVEGVTGDFKTELLRAFPDPEKLNQAMRQLGAQGEISGAALAALSGNEKTHYFGAENSALYAKGLQFYFSSRAALPAYQSRLDELNQKIKSLKEEIFSKELMEFESQRVGFKKGEPQALASILEKANLKLSGFKKDFPHLAVLAQELQDAQSFSREALAAWSREVRRKIKNKQTLKEWSSNEQAWATGNLSDAQFAAYAIRFCRAQGWTPRIPEALRALAQRGEMLARMRSNIFLSEWENMLAKLEKKLAFKSDQTALLNLIHQSEFLNDWIKLELSRKTWNQTVKPFSVVSNARFRALSENLETLRAELVNSDFALFYKNAEMREKALLENTLKQMHRAGESTAVLIVGGFHAEGLTNELEARGISYSVLTPAISELPAENRYNALMSGDVSWKKFLRVENGQIKLYESFARAMTHRLLDLEGERKDPSRALANYKTWRENLIRGIHGAAAQKNLRALSLLDEIVLEAVYPEQYPSLKASWKNTFAKLMPALQRLKKAGKLNQTTLASSLNAMTMKEFISTPFVLKGPVMQTAQVSASPATSRFRATSSSSKAIAPAFARSEFRKAPKLLTPENGFKYLPEYWIASFAMEAGLPRHILDAIEKDINDDLYDLQKILPENTAREVFRAIQENDHEELKKFGVTGGAELAIRAAFEQATKKLVARYKIPNAQAATLIAQVTLTGGLGALMPDLYEAHGAIETGASKGWVGLNPLWNRIKNKPEKGAGVPWGDVIKSKMKLRGDLKIQMTLELDGREREIEVAIYETEMDFHKEAKQYYLDARYADTREPVFQEAYEDNYDRYSDMIVFREAGQLLMKKLVAGKPYENKILVVDHEAFTSIPLGHFPDAIKVTLNHTVFMPGVPKPPAAFFKQLKFPRWMKRFITGNGLIWITDFVLLSYHLITGVSLNEHMQALRDNIFRFYWHKLFGFYDPNSKARSTNGIFFQRWVSPDRQQLKEKAKSAIGIPVYGDVPEVSDAALFEALNLPDHADQKKDFMQKNEAISAIDAAQLMIWLYRKHKIKWLFDSFKDYMSAHGLSEAALISRIEQFSSELTTFLKADRAEPWSVFLAVHPAFNDFIQAALNDPILTNLRRQVAYKGPDKYDEGFTREARQALDEKSLSHIDLGQLFNEWLAGKKESFSLVKQTIRNAKNLNEIHETWARLLIGGRTFDEREAYRRFLYIKFLVELMSIEDRVATIENYNYYEAPIIFRGAQGAIMLSDEFLEASATSMMKVLANGGEVIGVFGGANPEIWVVVDENGKEIPVLDKDGNPILKYEQLAEWLIEKKAHIRNGILVAYDKIISTQAGGGRRPSTESLIAAVKQAKENRKDAETRQKRMFDSVASSPRVDATTSQALAHAHLFEITISKEMERRALIERSPLDGKAIESIPRRKTFVWRLLREGKEVPLKAYPSDPALKGGLLRTMRSFRKIINYERLWGAEQTHGQDLLVSLAYSAGIRYRETVIESHDGDPKKRSMKIEFIGVLTPAEMEPGQNLFDYFIAELEALPENHSVLTQRVYELREKAMASTNPQVRLESLSEIVELIDQWLLASAGKFLEAYLNAMSPDEIAPLRKNLENASIDNTYQPWAEYLVRYLDTQSWAHVLDTSVDGLHSYVVQRPGKKPYLVNINVAHSVTDEIEGGQRVKKARATVFFDKYAAQLLGFSQSAFFLVKEVKRGLDFKLHPVGDGRLGVGILAPLNIEVLELEPKQNEAAFKMHIATKLANERNAEGSVGEIERQIQAMFELTQPEEREAAFSQYFEQLAEIDSRSAVFLFSKAGVRIIQLLAAALAPQELILFEDWDAAMYKNIQRLNQLVEGALFDESQVVERRVVTSSHIATIVIAVKLKSGATVFFNLKVAPGFDREFNQGSSETQKLNTVIMPNELKFLGFRDAAIRDGMVQRDGAPAQYDGRNFREAWQVRIPAEDAYQTLIVTQRSETRSAAVRSEARIQSGAKTPVASTNNLGIFAAFFLLVVTILGSQPAIAAEVAAPAYIAAHLGDGFVPKIILDSARGAAAESKARTELPLAQPAVLPADPLEIFVAAHFQANPKTKLHLGFAMAYSPTMEPDSLEAKSDFLIYAEKIEALKRQHPDGLIENHMALLLPKKPSKEASAFSKKVGKVARVQTVANSEAMESFLMRNQEIFTFNLEGLNMQPSDLKAFRHLAVKVGGLPSAQILNSAVFLNVSTAAQTDITVKDVQEIARRYPSLFGFNGSLSINSILDAALLAVEIRNYIASMA